MYPHWLLSFTVKSLLHDAATVNALGRRHRLWHNGLTFVVTKKPRTA